MCLTFEDLLLKKERGEEITDQEWLESMLGDLSMLVGKDVMAVEVGKLVNL